VLAVRDLSVRFDTDDGPVHAVDRLSFTLAAQEVLGIVGESGCGKSVSVLSLLGLLPPTAAVSGQAAFGDIDLLKASRARLRRIRGKEVSFVFQEPMTSLNPAFKVGAGTWASRAARRTSARSSCSTSSGSPRRGGAWTNTHTSSRAGCGNA